MALYKGSIEIAGSVIGGNSSSIAGGFGGGVIDGSRYLINPNGTSEDDKYKIIKNTGTPDNFSYTVQNDCLLFITCGGYIPNFYINGQKITNESTSEFGYLLAPVKANSIITSSGVLQLVNYPITIMEYKLNSLNPQVAFPDYEYSNFTDIHESAYSPNGYTSNSDGFLLCSISNNSVESQETEALLIVYVNDMIVYRGQNVGSINEAIPILPITKGDVIKARFYYAANYYDSTSAYTWPVKWNVRFNNKYKSISINPQITGSSGGVIDGSKFELVNGDQNDHYKKTVTKTITTTATDVPIVEVYTVENDCGLYINHKNNYLPIRYYLDAEGTSPIFDTYDSNDTSDPQLHGVVIPVKAGTKIYAQSYTKQINNGVTYTFTFIEYKLNSITPQITMPDWDSSKADTINSGDTITQNGWIVVTRNSGGASTVFINGIEVGQVYNNQGVFDTISPIPVSKGDVVTLSNESNVSVSFYPAKSVDAKLNVEHRQLVSSQTEGDWSDWDEIVTELPDGTIHIHACGYSRRITQPSGLSNRLYIPRTSKLIELQGSRDKLYMSVTPYTEGNNSEMYVCSSDQYLFETIENQSNVGVYMCKIDSDPKLTHQINCRTYWIFDGYLKK